MPFIKSFSIEGLAGRVGATERTLNQDVNVFFGSNGSGKTSLLRILHSALSHDANLLKNVPFDSAQLLVTSWAGDDFSYQISKESFDQAQNSSNLFNKVLNSGRNSVEWQTTPADTPWIHVYLPIARLYEGSATVDFSMLGSRTDSEMDLEARFASSLQTTWKDYRRNLSNRLNEIQERGLARILERVLSRKELSSDNPHTDSSTAFEAVSTFLARRRVDDITPSFNEFTKRYSKEPQFRGLVQEIEDIEKKITDANGPIRALQNLVREMFIGTKDVSLTGDDIEIAIKDKKLSLSSLSSGEKQLLKILVATVNAGVSVILVDEPELSLHVDWQRRLIPAMQTLNPYAQLIVATHSPEIMAEIPDNQVFQI